MDKQAGPFDRLRGFFGGLQQAGSQHYLQQAANTLQAAGHQVSNLKGVQPGAAPMSLRQQLSAGVAGSHQAHADAQAAAKAQQLAQQRALVERHGGTVSSPGSTPTSSQPSPQPSSSQPPPAAGMGSGSPAPSGPGVVSRAAPYALGAAGLGALGYAAYQGSGVAGEQDARAQDYLNHMRGNMTAPPPSMTVLASYEKFAADNASNPWSLTNAIGSGAANAVAGAFSKKLIEDPLDALHRAVKRKLYDEPEWDKSFNEALKDEYLSRAHQEDPQALRSAFDTLKRFSGTSAKDPNITKSWLMNARLTGGRIDPAAGKQLAETEKLVNESKRTR